jgi:hypothetical protein
VLLFLHNTFSIHDTLVVNSHLEKEEKGGQKSATAYFGVLMTSLATQSQAQFMDNPSQLEAEAVTAALLTLLYALLPKYKIPSKCIFFTHLNFILKDSSCSNESKAFGHI